MPSADWILALVELIYFTPTIIPVCLVLWKHRQINIHGWFFLFIFVILQITGSGMAVGSNGRSVTAIIIVEVGLSPLLLGLAGVIKECADMVAIAADRRVRRQRSVILLLYHFFVAGAVALYAVGAAKQPSTSESRLLAKVGIILLAISWVFLLAGLAYLHRSQSAITATRPLLWSVTVGCVLLNRRVRRQRSVILLLYHFFVAGAVALYAVGAAKQPSTSESRLLAKVGIILLAISWVFLLAGLAYLHRSQSAITATRPLLWSVTVGCVLLLVRIVYQCVATFEMNKQEFNPVSGSMVFKVVLQFLPGALILAVMVTGGVMTIELASGDQLQSQCFDIEHKLRRQV
nr:hypothetical protein CFP56_75880 [Quercus suber]